MGRPKSLPGAGQLATSIHAQGHAGDPAATIRGELHDGPVDQQYGYNARALMGVQRYFGGAPFYRQQSLQQLFGVPVSASTVFDQCEGLADAIQPLVAQACNDTRLVAAIQPALIRQQGRDTQDLKAMMQQMHLALLKQTNSNLLLQQKQRLTTQLLLLWMTAVLKFLSKKLKSKLFVKIKLYTLHLITQQ